MNSKGRQNIGFDKHYIPGGKEGFFDLKKYCILSALLILMSLGRNLHQGRIINNCVHPAQCKVANKTISAWQKSKRY